MTPNTVMDLLAAMVHPRATTIWAVWIVHPMILAGRIVEQVILVARLDRILDLYVSAGGCPQLRPEI